MKTGGLPYGYGKTTTFTTGIMLPTSTSKDNTSVAARNGSGTNNSEPEEVSPSTHFNFNVYPNPSKDVFRLNVESDLSQSVELKVYDATGIQMHSSFHQTNEQIEIGRDFKSGMYILRVATPSGLKSIKVMKE